VVYTFVPYGRLQQGSETAPNPSGLGVDVHLGVLELQAIAPTGTSVDLQLPFGSLVESSLAMRREDSGIGDLELRVRQSAAPLVRVRGLALGGALGVVVPTGGYVARSDAANLPPEASYLTLGRGTTWGIAEVDARVAITPRVSAFAQLSGRTPFARTRDDFAWGSELRATAGARVARVTSWLALLAASDLVWRDGATEPDPFSGGRLDAANAGGWQWSVSPTAVAATPWRFTVAAGVRVPIASDVTGNQLVPQLGGFVALAYTHRVAPRRTVAPAPGRITVVDYWATWCAPCVEIGRALDAAAARWPDVTIVKVDATRWPADDAPRLPAEARGLPVIEVFDRRGVRKVILQGDAALRVVDEVEALRSSP